MANLSDNCQSQPTICPFESAVKNFDSERSSGATDGSENVMAAQDRALLINFETRN